MAVSKLPHILSDDASETVKDSGVDRTPARGKQTSGGQPIFVPIVLRMADFDHKVVQILLVLLVFKIYNYDQLN